MQSYSQAVKQSYSQTVKTVEDDRFFIRHRYYYFYYYNPLMVDVKISYTSRFVRVILAQGLNKSLPTTFLKFSATAQNHLKLLQSVTKGPTTVLSGRNLPEERHFQTLVLNCLRLS